MTSVISVQRENNSRKLPALPVIQHPLSRLGNKAELQVRGSSRKEYFEKDSRHEGLHIYENKKLSSVKRNNERRLKHSRFLTWTFGNNGIKCQSQLPWVTKKSPLEVEELIKEKLTTGFSGLRQAFKSNDPLGRGNISREALTTILYHLCGYLSTEQIDGLLHRLRLNNKSTISFDSFIKHFSDVEVVQKDWVDPVHRPSTEEMVTANMPANQLRAKQRQIDTGLKQNDLKSRQEVFPSRFKSALQVIPFLKNLAQNGKLNYTKIFPAACFTTDGMVLKPQLRTALLVTGIRMYDEEFDKVWDRFDSSGTGAMESSKFFSLLGVRSIEKRKQNKTPSPKAIDIKDSFPDVEPRDDNLTENDKVDEETTFSDPDVTEYVSEKNKDSVLKVLDQKLKDGYNSILQSFLKFDPDKTGKVKKDDFRKVLAEYHLYLGAKEVDLLLGRCGMQKEPMVCYRILLDYYQDRSQKGMLRVVIEDSKHRFNQSRDSAIGDTTAFDAEAKLLDLLQSDFLSLLGAFKQLDRHRVGVVPRYHFKNILESQFRMTFNDEQLYSILKLLSVDPDEVLVPYPKFLELFGLKRNKKEIAEIFPQGSVQDRPRTCPTQIHASLTLPRSLNITKDVERSLSKLESREHLARDTYSLLVTIRDLITDRFHIMKKTHHSWTSKQGTLDRESFRRLMERHDLTLSSAEVDGLWSKFPTDADNMVSFSDVVKYCLSVLGKKVRLSRALQEYAKVALRKSLDTHTEVVETFEEENEQLLSEGPEQKEKHLSPRSLQRNKTKTEKPSLESVVKTKVTACFNWQELLDDFKSLDLDKNNTLMYDEFQFHETKRFNATAALERVIDKMRPKMISEWKILRRTFKKLDVNGDGFLSVSEFRDALQSLDFSVTEEDFYHIFTAYDIRMNGSISYVDFMRRFHE